MKSTAILLFFLWSLNIVLGQQNISLTGSIVEQNSKYRTGSTTYLSNVEVKSVDAISQRSDNDGKFTLVFAEKPNRAVVRIFAMKKGYEVVNEEELKHRLIGGRFPSLKIVMCPAAQLFENQTAYYNIAKEISMVTYHRKVAILQKEGKEKEQLIAELQMQFKQDVKNQQDAIVLLDKQQQVALKQSQQFANKWAMVNLDDQNQVFQKVFAAFESKNIELAKSILDTVDLEKNRLVNSRKNAKEEELKNAPEFHRLELATQIQQEVNLSVLKASFYILNYEWADAERLYDLAIQYENGNFDASIEAVYFMQTQGQFSKAAQYAQKALGKSTSQWQKSEILHKLGLLFKTTNDFIEAKRAHEDALLILKKLAELNPDVYTFDVVSTLSDLGILLAQNNDLLNAKKNNEAAVLILRELTKTDPDIYMPNLATMLHNSGIISMSNDNKSEAKQVFDESLKIYQQLATKNPDLYLADLNNNVRILHDLLIDSDDNTGAINIYQEVLPIYRQLAKEHPDLYLSDLASTLYWFGKLLIANDDTTGTRKAFKEAAEHYKYLAVKNPKTYNKEIAFINIELGFFHLQLVTDPTEDTPIKKETLALMKDASKRLSIYSETDPDIKQYRRYILQITHYFEGFSEDTYFSSQLEERVFPLERINEKEKDHHQKVLRQEKILNVLSEIEKNISQYNMNNLFATRYGSLSWYRLLDKQFAAAEQSAQLGIQYDSSEVWININLALALLYQGKWSEAQKIYGIFKDEKYGSRTFRDIFLDDLLILEKEKIVHPDAEKFKAFLQN